MFTNPVLDRDFADPYVLKVGDVYHAYATNAGGINIQTALSTSYLLHWKMVHPFSCYTGGILYWYHEPQIFKDSCM